MAVAGDYGLANSSVSSAAEFFERGVLRLHLSDGIEGIGTPNISLVLCLIFVYLVIYFSLWKGVHTSGKVVWVTATMPYVVLTILLARGSTLPGAVDGIKYFIVPRPDRLLDPQVWIDAAVQICYSVGAGFGVHIAFASYNKFHSNCYRDSMVTVSINAFTSIFSGFVVFAYLGYIAFKSGLPIDKVVAEGPGLVFIVYPEAIATLPASFIWSIMFFIMLFTLGIDSAMGGLEAPLSGIRDELRHWFSKVRYSRELLTLAIVAVCFLLALPQVTAGGAYLVTFWDTYAAGTAILFGIFMEAVAVSWFYGLDNFCADFEKMLRFRPNIFWRLCWKFISPAVLLAVILSSIITHSKLTYWTYTFGLYIFPSWSSVLGWTISVSSMFLVPAFAIYKLYSIPGTLKQKLAIAISPQWEHQAIVQNRQISRFKLKHWLQV